MRWMVLAGLLAACTTETVEVPVTVVHVDVQTDCGSACSIGLGNMCGYDMPLVEPSTTEMIVFTQYQPSELAGLVQIQYPGPLTNDADGTPGHLDNSLAEGDHVDVYALFGLYDTDRIVYRIDPHGSVTDVNATLLTAAEGNTLQFTYGNVTEVHTIDSPRAVDVQTDDAACYCSLAGPHDLGLVLAMALLPLRRRRGRA
jgi:hypothetical protein